jgi:hypothetical protein
LRAIRKVITSVCRGSQKAALFVARDTGVKGLMRNFVIFVQGENFNLEVDGKTQPAGFFASRRTEAKTEDEASRIAIAQLMSEPEIKGKELHDFTVLVKVAHEMPLEHKNTYSGFTLFPMEEV